MKKVILMLFIAALATASFGQVDTTATKFITNRVIKKDLNQADRTFLQLASEQVQRVDKEVNQYKFNLESRGDTIYDDAAFVDYVTKIYNAYEKTIDKFLVTDTIPVYFIKGEHYVSGDMESIEDKKKAINKQINTLNDKWGEAKVKESSQGQNLLLQRQTINGYLKQLETE